MFFFSKDSLHWAAVLSDSPVFYANMTNSLIGLFLCGSTFLWSIILIWEGRYKWICHQSTACHRHNPIPAPSRIRNDCSVLSFGWANVEVKLFSGTASKQCGSVFHQLGKIPIVWPLCLVRLTLPVHPVRSWCLCLRHFLWHWRALECIRTERYQECFEWSMHHILYSLKDNLINSVIAVPFSRLNSPWNILKYNTVRWVWEIVGYISKRSTTADVACM